MRALDVQLALAFCVRGANVEVAIQDTLIAMAKDAYVRGEAEIDYLETIIPAILGGQPIAMLQPGERVLSLT